MILFEKDWDKYPAAVVHNTTTNRSWVRMSLMYRDKFKLTNYKWPLALLDPSLYNVDPFALNLTDLQKLAIINECALNPMYFYREILRIPAKSGLINNRFRCDRGTLATLWCYHNHLTTTNIQLRQTGKTIKIEAPIIWLLVAGSFSTKILYGTIDSEKRKDCVRNLKETLNILPDYIYRPVKRGDADNTTDVTNLSRRNSVIFAIGQKEKKSAERAGRGYAIPTRIFDEVAETANAHTLIGASSSSSNDVINEAKKNGDPYGTIFACTAGTLEREEGLYYHNLSAAGMGWNEILFDSVDVEDLYETVGNNSRDPRAPMVDITLSYRQLGITTERFADIVATVMRDSNGDMDRVNRDCYSIWSRGGTSNPLTKPQIQTIFDSEMEPVLLEKTKEKIIVKWYVNKGAVMALGEAGRVAIGMDTSQGVNRDSCSLTVVDIVTFEVLARADIALVNLSTYTEFTMNFAISIPKSLLVIENKISGQGIIDAYILKLHSMGEDPFTRIYNNVVQSPERNVTLAAELKHTPVSKRSGEFYNPYKRLFGVSTNASIRSRLYDEVLTDAIRMGGGSIRDAVLSKQLRVLEERNGRVDHPKDGNDDAVISYLMVGWLCSYGRNLKHYCIDGARVLSETVSTEDGSYDAEAYKKQKEVLHLNEVLNGLEEQYRLNYDTMLGYAIKEKMVKVFKRFEELGVVSKNLDQILEGLKEDGARRKKGKAPRRRM